MITGNTADLYGGGVHCREQGAPSLVNCVINQNSASYGGGVDCARSSDPMLSNCILWHNAPQAVFINNSNPSIISCDVQGGWPGTGNIDADPFFVRNPSDGGDGWGDDPATPDVDESANDDFGDLHLRPSSPCIDAGNNALVPPDTLDLDADGDTAEPLPFDLDGLPRFADDLGMIDRGDPGSTGLPVVDIGAYEFQGQTCVGDITGDYLINLDDLAQLLGHYGRQPDALYPDGDFDADGDVDLDDLAELLGRYGAPCP
jgi:hypothetical protein